MRYLGIVRRENGTLTMPDLFRNTVTATTYEAIQVGENILLLVTPLEQERKRRIVALTDRSIEEHRPTLEGLAQ